MKKYDFLVLITIFFTLSNLLIYSSLVYSQLPNLTECSIYLNKDYLFKIYDKVNYPNCAQRKKEIENRLKKIARDFSIKINNNTIKVEVWDSTTNILNHSDVIISLTNTDIRKAKDLKKTKVSLKDKIRLANQYRQVINKSILKYRSHWFYTRTIGIKYFFLSIIFYISFSTIAISLSILFDWD